MIQLPKLPFSLPLKQGLQHIVGNTYVHRQFIFLGVSKKHTPFLQRTHFSKCERCLSLHFWYQAPESTTLGWLWLTSVSSYRETTHHTLSATTSCQLGEQWLWNGEEEVQPPWETRLHSCFLKLQHVIKSAVDKGLAVRATELKNYCLLSFLSILEANSERPNHATHAAIN